MPLCFSEWRTQSKPIKENGKTDSIKQEWNIFLTDMSTLKRLRKLSVKRRLSYVLSGTRCCPLAPGRAALWLYSTDVIRQQCTALLQPRDGETDRTIPTFIRMNGCNPAACYSLLMNLCMYISSFIDIVYSSQAKVPSMGLTVDDSSRETLGVF